MKESRDFTPDEIEILDKRSIDPSCVVRLEYFFDDWYSMSEFPVDENHAGSDYIEVMTENKNGHVMIVITQKELERIHHKKKEILDCIIDHYLQSAISDFELWLEGAGNPSYLIGDAIEQVNRFLLDKEYNQELILPRKPGHEWGEFYLKMVSEGVRKKRYVAFSDIENCNNHVAHWYKYFGCNESNFQRDVKADWMEKKDLSAPVAALVFQRLLKYLEQKKDGESKDKKGTNTPSAEITASTFINFFDAEKKGFNRVINALLHFKMIEKNSAFANGYKWVYDDRREGKTRIHGIRAMWYAAKEAELIEKGVKNNKTICEAIKVFFGLESLAHNTLDNVNKGDEEINNEYGRLYKKLFAQMVKRQ